MGVPVTDLDWETESSSSEDQEEINFLYGGHALSILSGLEESIGKIDDFLSFDRAFVQGDVVCSLTDPSGQMGRVTRVDVSVDLENFHGKVFKNIHSNKLMKIRSISEGDYVVKGPWLGRVQRVVDRLTILFDDGTKCQVTGSEKENLFPLTHKILEDSQYPYYPGLRVKVKSSIASKPARWLCGTWRDNQDEGTVCAVEACLVYVNWLASAPMTSNLSVNSPPCCQDSANLTLLSYFSHANWQLGDWCMLPVTDEKEQMEQNFQDASACNFTEENSMARGYERRNLHSNTGEIFIIGKVKTKVDIMWQDGQHSLGLDPQSLLLVNVINTHEFWPQQFVLEKGVSDDPLKPLSQRWGVVQHVDAKECTVKVQWKTVSISRPENLPGERVEETVSAYELVEHPDYSYCLGDIVIKAAQKQLGYQADKYHEKSAIDLNVQAAQRDSNCISYQNEFPDNCYLSCIGNITGFRDGAVEVKWATGLTTKVAPSEIFQIEKYEEATAAPVPSETNVEELSQEMIEHQLSEQKGKGMSKFGNEKENSRYHSSDCSPFTLPQAAIELFTSIKASIFQTLGLTSLSGAVSLVPTSEEGNGSGFLDKKRVSRTCDNICTESHPMSKLQSAGNIIPDEEVMPFNENKDFQFSFASNNSNQFKQFDILDNCSDHHFFGDGKGFVLSEVKRGLVKKVQQEWRILEKNLPETIFVRGFEERMDLLRAAIVGAPGTPYHDGLFFFDICFPPQYPSEPPMVHYNSGGLRLNPNLYESGKVCLSLLNTWTGTGTEVWNPETSTVLQVLLSLQALVLNEKPYFNEAGYDQQIGQAEGEKNSVGYNENAYLMTCKSMLYLLRRPSKHFEELVDEHFKQRSQQILLACKAYLEGAPIGCAFRCGKSEYESQKGTSTGFKLMLAKLFPKLLEAFSDKGIDCSQFVELQRKLCY